MGAPRIRRWAEVPAVPELRATQADPILSGPLAGDQPQFIGHYRIIGRLGEGGMGVVYLAEQTEPVRREVAIKVLREARSESVVARFELERQSLAVMEHPGITKVFDAGVTDAGWPYFVMERIAGVPITDFADAHRLDIDARLRLVIQVCHAVQHAHQKGTIHRDLKPSNILVSQAGDAEDAQCKVIDFGIAKAIAPTVAEHLTMTGFSLGTPAYMSPEQASGSGVDVDTRSDIYSLGVVLYELLTGVLPMDIPEGANPWAVLAQQAYRDAPTPAARLAALGPEAQHRVAEQRRSEPPALARALRGDLDNVVLRTLDKDRERRYSSAAALAQDLERYLANEPVLATPPSRGYRVRKFVRRHRAAVSFATAAVLLLIGFSVTTAVQARRIAAARQVAESRQAQAEDLIGFMLGDLRTRLTAIGKLDVLDAVGEKGLAYFAAVPSDQLSNEELFRRSVALRQLGDLRVDQGKLSAARASYASSLALARGLVNRDPTVGEWQLGLGASDFGVGYIEFLEGRADSALTYFNDYVRIAQALVLKAPDSLSYKQELAEAQSNIGSVQESKGDLPAALAAFESALATKQALVHADTNNLDWRLDLSHTYSSVAVIQRKLGDLAGAAANHGAELALRESLVAAQPANWPWVRYVAISESYLGDLLTIKGSVADAIVRLRAADTLYEHLVAHDPTNAEWARSLANTERMMGVALLEAGQSRAALPIIERSRARITQLLAKHAASRDWQQQLASTNVAYANALLREHRTSEGLRAAQQAVAEARGTATSAAPDVNTMRSIGEANVALGSALEASGRAAEARAAWSAVVARVDSAATHSGQTDLLALDAAALLHLHRAAAAAPIIQQLRKRGYAVPSFVALSQRPAA
jgi:serine/threonine protein kinase